ncbi:MAG: peroxiredoxin [Patescibacteria group bacterium]|jgi:peroxiredoxin Q/BCP
MLKEKIIAPDFTLLATDGEKHTLSNYRGQWILLYFYPKDDTPGCTKEACSFRDNLPNFDKLGVKVFGISADSPESHKKFINKYGLNFILLSDEEKSVIKTYEAGSVFTKRISYLIDPDGKIFKAYEKVNPSEHAAEVLKDLPK